MTTRLDGFAETGQSVLMPGQAVVRWLHCDSIEDRWLALLDPIEQERAARFHFAADRASFVAAHALTRSMLTRYGGLPPREWRFATGPFGKPAVDPALGRSWLRFNLSHTRGMAACMVMRDMEVGVDVEALDRQHDAAGIAERFFGPKEVRLLEEGGKDAFLRLWTLKESVMKATGQGFSLALDAFAVTLDPPGVRFAAGERGPWSFKQRDAGPRHIVAVAVRSADAGFDLAEWA